MRKKLPAVALGLAVTLLGCQSTDDDKTPVDPVTVQRDAEAPDRVFSRAQRFWEQADFVGYAGCLTTRGQQHHVATASQQLQIAWTERLLEPKAKPKFDETLQALFEKHNYDPSVQTDEELERSALAVPDYRAFCAELLEIAFSHEMKPLLVGELQGVQITGATATAVVLQQVGKRTRETPTSFAKTNGAWLIDGYAR